jgi:hypothetical protein
MDTVLLISDAHLWWSSLCYHPRVSSLSREKIPEKPSWLRHLCNGLAVQLRIHPELYLCHLHSYYSHVEESLWHGKSCSSHEFLKARCMSCLTSLRTNDKEYRMDQEMMHACGETFCHVLFIFCFLPTFQWTKFQSKKDSFTSSDL